MPAHLRACHLSRLCLIYLGHLCLLISSIWTTNAAAPFSKTALLRPSQALDQRLRELRDEGFTSVALFLTETNAPALEGTAVEAIRQTGLELDYWIEIARNQALADQHPEWMASIQTHPEWRRFFPTFGPTPSNTVVKVYPWTPVLYQETFPAHLQRVTNLVQQGPRPRHLFLNDLQGAPSACGCGNTLCRWTTDYGPLKTATRLPDTAAAQFLAAVKHALPGVEVVPVWTTECEDSDHDRVCGGVNCFHGTCWGEWTSQLEPVAAECELISPLLLDRVFERNLVGSNPSGGWIGMAVNYFQQLPARYHSAGVPSRRLLPVVEGWDLPGAELTLKISQAAEAGTAGVVVAFTPLDQSWTPKPFAMPSLVHHANQ
jgi:hypothetical protein